VLLSLLNSHSSCTSAHSGTCLNRRAHNLKTSVPQAAEAGFCYILRFPAECRVRMFLFITWVGDILRLLAYVSVDSVGADRHATMLSRTAPVWY
jgi:hypothetical protein